MLNLWLMVWILVCEFWWVKFMWIMLWVYVNSGVWVYVNSGDTNLCEFMWILVCEFWWYKFMWICAKNDMSCFSKLQKMTCSVSPIKIQKNGHCRQNQESNLRPATTGRNETPLSYELCCLKVHETKLFVWRNRSTTL